MTVSCAQEIFEESSKPQKVTEGILTVDFTVKLPESAPATKAMAHLPQLTTLHLAVFDQAGYLREYVKADPIELATTNTTKYTYSVQLQMSENPCTIHFIGNGPESVKFGTEEVVLNSIKSSNGADLYWNRRSLDNIAALAADEFVQPDDYTIDMLTDVPLIRNFAKVVLTSSSTSNFTLKKYTVVNCLKSGTVAPYNSQTRQFVQNYESKTYANLIAEGYDGSIPTDGEFVTVDDVKTEGYEWVDVTDSDTSDDACYVYERETPISEAAYILAYGTYTTDGKDYYYKIDLRNGDEYFPLLRNIVYNISITLVDRAGNTNIDDAAASAGTGDISTSQDNLHLVYISDGVAALEVGYISKVVTIPEEQEGTVEVDLPFKYIPDVTKPTVMANNSVTFTINPDFASTGPAVAGLGSRDNADGIVKVKLNASGGLTKVQSITASATHKDEESGTTAILSRKVTYTVMPKQALECECVPGEVPELQGSAFELKIKLPERLPQSMFPLELMIEAANGTITPDANNHLPVGTGKSLTGNNNGAFYFIRTLTYEEYSKATTEEVDGVTKHVISAYFKTNKAESDTDIYVAHEHFITAKTHLYDYTPEYFQNLKYSIDPVACTEGVEVEFTFTLSEVLEAGKNITVYLGGLRPTDNQLTSAGSPVDGKAVYSLTPTSDQTSFTLSLETVNQDDELYVGLEAFHFIPNSLTAVREWKQFTTTLANANVKVGETTTFTYTYDSSMTGSDVILTFDGLASPTCDTGTLTDLGAGKWRFEPADETQVSHQLSLVTTTFGDAIGVTISAGGYETVTTTAQRILNANVYCTGVTTNFIAGTRTVYVYDNPSYENPLTSFSTANNQSHNINVVGVFNGEQLYFRYSTTLQGSFIASVKISDLVNNGSTTISFVSE